MIPTRVFVGGVCVFLLAGADPAAAVSQAEIDRVTAGWKCQWCPYDDAPVKGGEVEAGLGYVSNDSYKFGQYTGLEKQGGILIGGGSYRYRDGESRYMGFYADDVGLESRQLGVNAGVQGKYDLEMNYSMLPSFGIDTARTPYRGDENQRLPSSFLADATRGTTAEMDQLASSLRDVDIYTERKTIDVGASFHQSQNLSYDLNFQQQSKTGSKTMGFALSTNSVILAVPVDTSTKQGGVKVNYRARKWQGSLGYAFSTFTNANDSVRWDNAYTAPATSSGRASLEPGNEMQQITLDGAYHFTSDTLATLAMSLGRMSQDDDFLPYTINGAITASSLPRTSLNGEIDTFNAIFRFGSRFGEDWNYSAQYRHNEQSNNTPRATYSYVFADTANAATPRANLPYSFRERELSLQGKYQINKQRYITLEYQKEIDDRTYQEVDTTNEDTLSTFYRSKIDESLQWYLKLEGSNRVGDDYVAVSEISPPENSLLRKYNLADRKRKIAAASMSYSLTDDLQINVFGDYAFDDYSESQVGLAESKQTTISLELQYRISNNLSVNVDYSATEIDSSQIGTTWVAENQDSIYVTHTGVNYHLPKYKLSLGADYTHATFVGDISVSTGSGFPKLESTRKTFTLFADYSLDEKSVIHAYFAYEDYEENDWATDGVAPNTISNVLTLGETSPSYDIGVFAISYRTSF